MAISLLAMHQPHSIRLLWWRSHHQSHTPKQKTTTKKEERKKTKPSSSTQQQQRASSHAFLVHWQARVAGAGEVNDVRDVMLFLMHCFLLGVA